MRRLLNFESQTGKKLRLLIQHEVEQASHGLSAIAKLLVQTVTKNNENGDVERCGLGIGIAKPPSKPKISKIMWKKLYAS